MGVDLAQMDDLFIPVCHARVCVLERACMRRVCSFVGARVCVFPSGCQDQVCINRSSVNEVSCSHYPRTRTSVRSRNTEKYGEMDRGGEKGGEVPSVSFDNPQFPHGQF